MSIFVIKECNYGHDHSHAGHQHAHGESTKNLGIAFFLNLGLPLSRLLGEYGPIRWLLFPMQVHDFGDAFSIGVSYFLERYSRKKRTVTFTYGV